MVFCSFFITLFVSWMSYHLFPFLKQNVILKIFFLHYLCFFGITLLTFCHFSYAVVIAQCSYLRVKHRSADWKLSWWASGAWGLVGSSVGPSYYQPAFSLGNSWGSDVKMFLWSSLFFSREGTYSLLLGELVDSVWARLLTSWSWVKGGFRSLCLVLTLIMGWCHFTIPPHPVSPEHFDSFSFFFF